VHGDGLRVNLATTRIQELTVTAKCFLISNEVQPFTIQAKKR
jgi:hypothetical protein